MEIDVAMNFFGHRTKKFDNIANSILVSQQLLSNSYTAEIDINCNLCSDNFIPKAQSSNNSILLVNNSNSQNNKKAINQIYGYIRCINKVNERFISHNLSVLEKETKQYNFCNFCENNELRNFVELKRISSFYDFDRP